MLVFVQSLKNWDIKHLCLFSKLAATMGAYNCGVLKFMGANKCMQCSDIVQLCGNELAVIYYCWL